jgi:hypothetical protein
MMTAANTPTKKLPTRPRTAAFHAAEAQLHKLYRALQAAGDSPESEALYKEYEAADAERDAAFAAWRDSDEPRVYSLGDGGSDCTITCSPSKLEESVINAWSDAFEPDATTWRCHVTASCTDGTNERFVIQIEPEVPACADDGDHDFDSPNDFVRGHGGGVIISTVCAHCGITRTIDTWATDSYDGTQGHRYTSYKPAEDNWIMPTQWVAIGSDGTRLVIWAAGATQEDCNADLANQALQTEDIGQTCTLEIPAFFDVEDIEVRGRRWLECKTLRDGSVRITCDVTGDSAVYGTEM